METKPETNPKKSTTLHSDTCYPWDFFQRAGAQNQQPYPFEVLNQQCFASLGHMSGDSGPESYGTGWDEAGGPILGPCWSEQTQTLWRGGHRENRV